MGSGVSEEKTNREFTSEEDAIQQESLGSYLRKERLKKGLNLREIAEGTCIHIATLKALEEDDDSRMPAEVFTRGFLRLYAEYIGIDPGDILKRYERAKSEGPYRSGDDNDGPGKRKVHFFRTGPAKIIYAVLFLLILSAVVLFLSSGNLPF